MRFKSEFFQSLPSVLIINFVHCQKDVLHAQREAILRLENRKIQWRVLRLVRIIIQTANDWSITEVRIRAGQRIHFVKAKDGDTPSPFGQPCHQPIQMLHVRDNSTARRHTLSMSGQPFPPKFCVCFNSLPKMQAKVRHPWMTDPNSPLMKSSLACVLSQMFLYKMM